MAHGNVGAKEAIYRLLWEVPDGTGDWFTTQWWDYHAPRHPAMLAKIADVKTINERREPAHKMRARVAVYALREVVEVS